MRRPTCWDGGDFDYHVVFHFNPSVRRISVRAGGPQDIWMCCVHPLPAPTTPGWSWFHHQRNRLLRLELAMPLWKKPSAALVCSTVDPVGKAPCRAAWISYRSKIALWWVVPCVCKDRTLRRCFFSGQKTNSMKPASFMMWLCRHPFYLEINLKMYRNCCS